MSAASDVSPLGSGMPADPSERITDKSGRPANGQFIMSVLFQIREVAVRHNWTEKDTEEHIAHLVDLLGWKPKYTGPTAWFYAEKTGLTSDAMPINKTESAQISQLPGQRAPSATKPPQANETGAVAIEFEGAEDFLNLIAIQIRAHAENAGWSDDFKEAFCPIIKHALLDKDTSTSN